MSEQQCGKWFRRSPFEADYAERYTETWEYVEAGETRSFDVDIQIGKPLDVMSLKGSGLAETREYADFLKQTAARLYTDKQDYARLSDCVMCGHENDESKPVLEVYGVAYHRCVSCGHVAVHRQPVQAVLDEIFAESETHSSIYIDEKTLSVRMQQVVQPKLNWVVDKYRAKYGRAIETLSDVGAGGGHFVAGARAADIDANGYEKSVASRRFCSKAFGFDLLDADFLDDSATTSVDVVTMWGLLEYVQEPRTFLKKARKILNPEGMLIVEVPRVDGLGTWVQGRENSVVARHMDPTSHVNGFTDMSLCNALIAEGFAPIGAWYFGMDAYELIVQMGCHLGSDELFDKLIDFIPEIQAACDHGKQCDDIIVAAIPV